MNVIFKTTLTWGCSRAVGYEHQAGDGGCDRGLCRAGDQVPAGQGERRDGQGEATHKAALQG